MTARARRPDAGFSIVTVVTALLLLLILGAAAVTMVSEDSDLSLSHVAGHQAFYLAQAGIEFGLRKLETDWSWQGLPPPGKAVGDGSFWVARPDTLDAEGRPLPPGQRRLIATGIVGRSTRELQVHVGPGSVSTVAGGDIPIDPRGLAVALDGDLYLADGAGHVVRKLDVLTGSLEVVAGTGAAGSGGNGGPAKSARLLTPEGVCVAPNGDIYVADSGARVVRRVSAATEAILPVAGNGSRGDWGDGGSAAEAAFEAPSAVALGPNGDLYVVDRGAHRVRRVSAATGVIETVAGTGAEGFSGDGGPAKRARLRAPGGVAVAPNGDLYVADAGNHAIRRVAAATGIITTVAGTEVPGFSGDGGPAAAARLSTPQAVAFGPTGDLFIADTGNHRIRRVEIGTGIITTVAGRSAAGFDGDGSPSTEARFDTPCGVAVSPTAVYYVADRNNHRVRRVGGVLSVVAWIEARV
jgi:hypothetical protein